MSMASLERAILAGAKVVLRNSSLRGKDILAWSTTETGGAIIEREGEVIVHIPDPGVYIQVDKAMDKRKKK